jgi:hypothetical protein
MIRALALSDPEYRMVERSLLLSAAVGILITVAAACSTIGHPSPSQAKLANLTELANLPGKPACFWKSNFQGDWTVLNDSTLIVRAPLRKNFYVIKLFEPVFDLSFKQRLGFVDREHTGQICNDGDDYLVVPGWQQPQVPITAVRALTTAEGSELLRAAGMSAPHPHASPVPNPPKS